MTKDILKLKRGTAVVLILVCIFTLIFALSFTAHGKTTSRKSIPMQMYQPSPSPGYTMSNAVDKTVYGSSAYTSLAIETNNGNISLSTHNGFLAYGVSGSDAVLKFKINHAAAPDQYLNGSSQWMLHSDSYGAGFLFSFQTVNGIQTGKVASGALIVQTSSDGKNWSNENMAKYTDGLYTTDFYNHYRTNETEIYYPDGADISRGVYIRVIYAYEVYDYVECTHYKGWLFKKQEHENDNVYRNYLEVYSFYLFNNSPQAVTFHNISATDKLPSATSDEDGNIIEAYKQCETLLSGSGTFSGFIIDNDTNLSATIEVRKNGSKISIPNDKKFTSTGKYDITVTTKNGTVQKTTIYVDTSSNKESMAEYFGAGFLSGSKRIFSEGDLPVFEGGRTTYSLNSITNNKLPLSGTIKNLTTGSVIYIEATRKQKSGVLSEPGEYEAVFTTNPDFYTDKASGDARVFTFRFIIIKEGTAPGPVRNQMHLKNYATSSICDCYPGYYGITFPSAGKGFITLAFADYDSALDYAVNYEKGVVEKQDDGSYIYKGTLSISGKKQEYNSTWDMTDAIYYFAQQAVTRDYFDMSEQHTYLTLDDDILRYTSNLRVLELDRSVVVFASDEHRNALLTSDNLPVIYPKEHAYLTYNGTTEIKDGDFMFVKDKNGYDSSSVHIVDSSGKTFSIEYNRGVGQQLNDMGCASGVITIHESTVYGDSVTYKAIFIRKGENASSVSIDYMINGNGESIIITQKDNGTVFEANAFAIRSVTDSLDPYSIIKVVKDEKTQEQQIYCINEVKDLTFNEVGVYHITCVSRLGFTFSFSVVINTPCENGDLVEFLTSKSNETQKAEENKENEANASITSEQAEDVDGTVKEGKEVSSNDILYLLAFGVVLLLVIIIVSAYVKSSGF